MSGFGFFLCSIVFIYCAITWLIPQLLGWLIKRKFHIEARIGRIGIPFTLQDVHITKNGFSIHIDRIGFRSSFLSSEVTKLVSVVIRDVRINKDVVGRVGDDVSPSRWTAPMTFHDQKIPPLVITFAQFMAVHIRSVTAMFLRPESPEWLLHTTVTDLHIDGSVMHTARSLLVNVTVNAVTAKLLRHAQQTVPPSKQSPARPIHACLAELSVGLTAEATVVAQGPLSVQKVFIGLENTKAVINDGFYAFARERHKPKVPQTSQNYNSISVKRQSTFEFLHSISPVIPKDLSVKVKDAVLSGTKDIARLECLLIHTNFTPGLLHKGYSWPQASLDVQVDDLIVSGKREKILSLKKLSLEAKLLERLLNVHLMLNTLSVTYNHLNMYSWVAENFRDHLIKEPDENNATINVDDDNDGDEGSNCWNQLEFQGCAEFWNISSVLQLSDATGETSVGFTHLKWIFDCEPPYYEVNDRPRSWWRPKLAMGLSERSCTTELLIESAWCRLNEGMEFTPSRLKKWHIWGTPMFLGVALINAKATPLVQPRLQVMLDTVRLEWSPPLSAFVVSAVKCFEEYRSLRKFKAVKTEKETNSAVRRSLIQQQTPAIIIFCVTLTNGNVFLIADKKVCIMVRLDSTTVNCNSKKITMAVEGAKVAGMKPTRNHFTCVRSEEVKSPCVHIKLARIDRKMSDNTLSFELREEIEAGWSPNLHLKFLTLYEEIQEFIKAVSSSRTIVNGIDVISDSDSCHKTRGNGNENERPREVQIMVKGHLKFNLNLSSEHYLLFTTDDLLYGWSDTDCVLQSAALKIAVDGDNIFNVSGLKIMRIHDSEIVKVERANSEDFILPWNKTWGVSIDSLKAIFPYEHQFAAAVQNELISVVKWLKLVHRHQKQPSQYQEKPLPSDLIIKVTEFVFEMSDDPFEVRLRDNYELLVDEYKESLKRQKMLDAKVADMCKSRLLLPSGKVEELYANLNSMNGKIYVQRSRKMMQSGTRTRLFAWIMSDLELLALADPSIHGAENVVNTMTEIDCDTPWPEEGVEFVTLWCRSVTASCREWKFQLRDFPQPWLDIGQLHLWGRLVGAEQVATRRAKRGVTIQLGDPWGEAVIERSMTSLKFYHDFNCEVEHFSYAFGPCWEPVIAQCNLSFEKISRPSLDPSPPLSFWDKMRFLIHGRLTMFIRQLTVLLHASLDPYNTTEEMEITWSNVAMDWINAKVVFKGDLDVYVRTASKYDDCRLLHLPNLKLSIKLTWVCLGDSNDHHTVMPCAPDKLPEYSSNQVHDSFRAFRSQNLNVALSLETKSVPGSGGDLDCPVALLYGSTLRWFENLKLILSGITRPTRRGSAFNNLRPRKQPLSRHYRKIHLSLQLHRFQVHYWMSFAMQRGLELVGQRISSSSEHTLTLVPIDDGLKHRPRPEWAIMYMNCELNDAEIWLKSALEEEPGKEMLSLRQPVEKCYCLSVGKVSYGREAAVPGKVLSAVSHSEGTPTHRLVVHHLKGAWTLSNRDVAFALFDSFMKTKQLKKNLSTEALKSFRGDTSSTPLKSRNRGKDQPAATPTPQTNSAAIQATPSPMTKLQSGHAATMLQQLIAEAENKAVVFSDDMSAQTKEQHLQGLAACQGDDVVHKNWLIALVNSQVLLKGIETKGYVILSAAKAEILQRIHKPLWKDRTLVSKTTWVGSLECMQYYATVSAGENDSLDENIMWLSVENIQEKEGTVIADLPDVPTLVGSGQSVGGVVSETVGASSAGENPTLQLQRIVSRCKCEFFYAGYGESSLDPSALDEVPPPPPEEAVSPWERQESAVDAFTLMHYDLDVCTNSLQYAMILDIVNNLLLYVEPKRKEAYERLQRMRFQIQLHSIEDQRKPIQELQNNIRSLLSELRRLEKETYLVQRALADEPGSEHLLTEMSNLEAQVYECKEKVLSESDKLDMMLSCYKETQLTQNQKMATLKGDKIVTSVRASEICFKHAQWRLTDADGQLGIADLVLSNFLYTKNSKSDDSVEHLLELGYVRMTNLLPNQIYKEVIVPTEIQSNMPVDRKRAVRVFCREKAPVGGISVKEHFEINVVPLTIGLTKKFYDTMMKFCFPERDPDNIEGDTIEDTEPNSGSTSSTTSSKKSKSGGAFKKGKDSNFYVRIEQKDDVEKMKERAEKNKLFIYIKIPEVPVRVSYKGNKEKNLEDIRDFSLVIPTLEYHNVTWTWLDLLLAMKSDSRSVILSQAIKQKLQIKMNRGTSEEGASPQEEDKARMLFGARLMPGDGRILKKGVFKFPK
ncbi:bridge-like lipid transfer protein family member hobbit [Lycorma delicatula]|uniref:bridge-like lipid transfer protein family member hobbit n=1 Tax=Lycorma delicatula TaxID=130591 RepID=UPI003F5121C1